MGEVCPNSHGHQVKIFCFDANLRVLLFVAIWNRSPAYRLYGIITHL